MISLNDLVINKVDVYRNYSSKYRDLGFNVYSLRSRDNRYYWRVLGHYLFLVLHNCKFVVRERGREKVREEGRKNVHAMVRSDWVSYNLPVDFLYSNRFDVDVYVPDFQSVDSVYDKRVTYNPHTHEYFEVDGREVAGAGVVVCCGGGVYTSEEYIEWL